MLVAGAGITVAAGAAVGIVLAVGSADGEVSNGSQDVIVLDIN